MSSAAASSWHTAAELAAMGLPGLPDEPRRLRELAKVEGWAERTAEDGTPLVRERRARGGGIEFNAGVLPVEAQLRLRARARSAAPAPIADTGQDNGHADAWARFEALPASVQSAAHKRINILSEIEDMAALGAAKTTAVNTVAKLHGVSARAIADWYKLVRDVSRHDWLPFLAPNYKGGRQQEEIDADILQIIISDYFRPGKPAFAACYRRLEKWAKQNDRTLPNPKTLKSRVDNDRLKGLRKLKREGKEASRRTVPSQKRTVADLHAMYAINADGHTFDIRVEWEDGKIDRPVMVGVQDIYSRKLLSHRIDRSETTVLARMAFADAIRDYGLPLIALLDNGRAFASKALTGGVKNRFRFKVKDSEPTGMLTGLNIKINWSLPYRGSSKPIERAWRDLCEDISKHPRMEGAYTGNKPDAKPDNYGERAIPIAEFRKHVAELIAEHNARTGRDTETANGRSFDEVFAESYAKSVIPKATPEQIRLAMLEAEQRPCHKDDGSVTLAKNRYWTPEMVVLAGEKVSVRFDPDNLHGDVHIYRKGKFFCTAPVIEATGFFDKEGSKRRAKLEGDFRRKNRAAADALDLLKGDELAELFAVNTPPPDLPAPGAVGMVHHRETAAALKPISQAVPAPEINNFLDGWLTGASKLKLVE